MLKTFWSVRIKRSEHKTSQRILVSNTMNCNCIFSSESTPKLVKRLRQVFLLINQIIPLFTSLLCHFGRFLNNNSASFLNPTCCPLSRLCSLPLVFVLFSTFSFRCSLFSFLLYFGNLFVSIFHLLKQFLIKFSSQQKIFSESFEISDDHPLTVYHEPAIIDEL